MEAESFWFPHLSRITSKRISYIPFKFDRLIIIDILHNINRGRDTQYAIGATHQAQGSMLKASKISDDEEILKKYIIH